MAYMATLSLKSTVHPNKNDRWKDQYLHSTLKIKN